MLVIIEEPSSRKNIKEKRKLQVKKSQNNCVRLFLSSFLLLTVLFSALTLLSFLRSNPVATGLVIGEDFLVLH